MKVILIISALLSLVIISGYIGFIFIIISHLYITWKMIFHVKDWNSLSDFGVLWYIFTMLTVTAITKESIGYHNGAYIMNDVLSLGYDKKI